MYIKHTSNSYRIKEKTEEIKLLYFDNILTWSRFLFASMMGNRVIQGKVSTKAAEVKPCAMSRTSSVKGNVAPYSLNRKRMR